MILKRHKITTPLYVQHSAFCSSVDDEKRFISEVKQGEAMRQPTRVSRRLEWSACGQQLGHHVYLTFQRR